MGWGFICSDTCPGMERPLSIGAGAGFLEGIGDYGETFDNRPIV